MAVYEDVPLEKRPTIELQSNEPYGHIFLPTRSCIYNESVYFRCMHNVFIAVTEGSVNLASILLFPSTNSYAYLFQDPFIHCSKYEVNISLDLLQTQHKQLSLHHHFLHVILSPCLISVSVAECSGTNMKMTSLFLTNLQPLLRQTKIVYILL